MINSKHRNITHKKWAEIPSNIIETKTGVVHINQSSSNHNNIDQEINIVHQSVKHMI